MDWFRSHPVKSAVTLVVGLVFGFGLFVLDGFNSFASEPELDLPAAQDRLDDRTEEELADSLEQYYRRQAEALAESGLEDQERQSLIDELEGELRDRQVEIERTPLEIPAAISPVLPDEMFESILLIGTDASGYLADTIINVLLPSDGSTPLIVSIPRDLYVNDACTKRFQRINRSMGGCTGFAGGPDLLALNVGTFTGIEVDHYARVSFSGFETVVDRLGGAEVCTGEYPIRDLRSGLALDAGCQLADGEQTLAWVRSRSPEILVDGVWKSAGGSDFERQSKQQEILFQLADALSSYGSVGALTGALQNLASVVRMDSGFSAAQAASLGIQYRGIGPGDVIRLTIPVTDYRTGAGAQVLIPTRTFNSILAARYPAAGL